METGLHTLYHDRPVGREGGDPLLLGWFSPHLRVVVEQ